MLSSEKPMRRDRDENPNQRLFGVRAGRADGGSEGAAGSRIKTELSTAEADDKACMCTCFYSPQGAVATNDNPYMAIAAVAELIRKTPHRVRNLMDSGVFRESAHHFRPRGSTPLF